MRILEMFGIKPKICAHCCHWKQTTIYPDKDASSQRGDCHAVEGIINDQYVYMVTAGNFTCREWSPRPKT